MLMPEPTHGPITDFTPEDRMPTDGAFNWLYLKPRRVSSQQKSEARKKKKAERQRKRK